MAWDVYMIRYVRRYIIAWEPCVARARTVHILDNPYVIDDCVILKKQNRNFKDEAIEVRKSTC